MQLDAALRSFRVQCNDADTVSKFVIQKTTSDIHSEQYKYLQQENSDFTFIEECIVDETSRIVEQILEMADPYEFVSFHSDDNLYVNSFSLSEAIHILQQNENVLTYSLRLGSNIRYCYTCDIENRRMKQPQFQPVDPRTFVFNWPGQEYDFGYPFEVSASIYHSSQALPIIAKYKGVPATRIEAFWDNHKGQFHTIPFMACPVISKVVNVPINRVGFYPNKISEKFGITVGELAYKFSEGYRINIDQFSGFVSDSPHVELEFSFEKKVEK